MNRKPIYCLFFDRKGCGPAPLEAKLRTFDPAGPGDSTSLGIQFVSAGMIVTDSPVDGGLFFPGREGRECVAELHRRLGEWLEANP